MTSFNVLRRLWLRFLKIKKRCKLLDACSVLCCAAASKERIQQKLMIENKAAVISSRGDLVIDACHTICIRCRVYACMYAIYL